MNLALLSDQMSSTEAEVEEAKAKRRLRKLLGVSKFKNVKGDKPAERPGLETELGAGEGASAHAKLGKCVSRRVQMAACIAVSSDQLSLQGECFCAPLACSDQ